MSDEIHALSRYNLDEWEKEAKEHADSEAFAKPLLDAIAEIRKLMDESRRETGRCTIEQQRMGLVDRTVFDPDYSDRAVRLLLAHACGINQRPLSYDVEKRLREGGHR